jgi:hypothetical protein
VKYYVLTRDFSFKNPKKQFTFNTVNAKNKEKAWELVELDVEPNMGQLWLMTKKELEALKETLEKNGHFRLVL